MLSTPDYQFPYPEDTDAPDFPLYTNLLADKLDSEIYRLDGTPAYPFGIIARARATDGGNVSDSDWYFSGVEISAPVSAGRAYRIQAPCVGFYSTAYAFVETGISFDTHGVALGSNSIGSKRYVECSNSNNVESTTITDYVTPSSDATLKARLMYRRQTGTQTTYRYGSTEWPFILYIEDIGKVS